MANSVFLARLIGPFALLVGLALAFNHVAFKALALDFVSTPALVFLSGAITLPAALAIVLVHNVWTPDWRVLITLIGWLGVITSAFRILAPQRVAATGARMITRPLTIPIGAAIWLAIGALLCFFGYLR